MKRLALIFGCLLFASSPAYAIKEFAKQWKSEYAPEGGNANFYKAAKKANCNLCHVKGKSKKIRNEYGGAVEQFLKKEDFSGGLFKSDPEKANQMVLAGLEKANELKSVDGKTYAEKIAAKQLPAAEGFEYLFDGKSLKGWKKAEENPESWSVVDGKLACDGKRCHLFYDGSLAPLKNFHFAAEVMTTPGSNSGIYFHTKYQEKGWPKFGLECQVNVSQSDPKKTGSLYAIENISDPGVKDNEWYLQEIIVNGRNIKLKVNGKTLVDYTEPEGQKAHSDEFERRLGEGTFALQAHDPDSKVFFRNVRVKPLP